jgi:predicted DNA-binding protein with PD1-like motif
MIVSRILPGEDLKQSIEHLRDFNCLKSGIILCIVGSITDAVLRMPNGDKKLFTGLFEIVSAEGTVSIEGIHVHISISDAEGTVYGGHLLNGCKIYTTVELSIMESVVVFNRTVDPKTGFKELVVQDEFE